MEKLVIGLVQTHDEAEAAAERIIDCGYTRQEVSLLMTDVARDRWFRSPDVAPPSHTFGAAVAMSVVVPGFGFVVAGPLAAVVASAVGAGITGGLREILITAGVPKHWAERYEAGVRQGGILVSVFAHSERDVGLLHLVLDDPHMTSFYTEAHQHHAYDTSF
ncbi:hypothetical protein WME90_24005 [Sorangium sp. So ce375]|uniref:hypothetical protein n=1 Tax=Sorangium sp. So ce375 TaxID=3133306 RepID=UPI003F5B098E